MSLNSEEVAMTNIDDYFHDFSNFNALVYVWPQSALNIVDECSWIFNKDERYFIQMDLQLVSRLSTTMLLADFSP